MKPSLTQKRALHAQLKAFHGDAWDSSMQPTYDERGFAAVMFTRFDPALVARFTEYPVHWMELHLSPEDEPAVIRATIPLLLAHWGPYLETLDIRNTSSLVADTEPMRDVLPRDADCFAHLPALTQASFTRVNVTDGVVKALCQNPALRRFDVDEAPLTKRSVKFLAACRHLETVLLDRCRHFPLKYEPTLRRRLPKVETVRLR